MELESEGWHPQSAPFGLSVAVTNHIHTIEQYLTNCFDHVCFRPLPFEVSENEKRPDLEDQDQDQNQEQAGGRKMEILLELNLKQKLATRLGTILLATVIFGAFCWDNALASLTLGAVVALLLRNPTFVFALVMTASRDLKWVFEWLISRRNPPTSVLF